MKVLNKQVLAQTPETRITEIEIYAPEIARKALPGQFAILMVKAEGERIPLTVVDVNKFRNSVIFIFQEVGLTTKLLGKLDSGDSLYALAGPLGNATKIKKYGNVIIIGGGVGVAELYPVAKAFYQAGNRIITILGARTKELLILEDKIKNFSHQLYITTDDGSYGKKGFTSDILEQLLVPPSASVNYQLIYAVGPIPMMKKISDISKKYNIKTIVSLNALMVDGTGMCGCCRITVGEKVKFSCIDGPEFDAHLICWEELERKNKMYLEKERYISKLYQS